MENKIWNLTDECQSLKSVVRKKAVTQLSEILFEREAVQLLHSNYNKDRVNWNVLFDVSNRALILESECWKTDEAKGKVSSLVLSNREKSKTQFSGLITTIVKKANELKRDTLKCEDVLGACVRVLSDPYLERNFGSAFSAILRDYVLPVRKYRIKLRNDQWEELFDLVLDHLKTIAEEWNNSALHTEFDLMMKVIRYGCRQSHLGISVKNKLLPFLKDKFDVMYANPSVQESLLSLVLSACTIVVKETRSGVCLLGESILASVIKMFEPKLADKIPRNKLVVDFLLFQMQCHHPNGAKQGADAAYACNWDLWNEHLTLMYRAVFSTISRRSKALGSTPFSDAFLDLAVELCYQLFDKSKSYNISMTIIETQQGPAPKRRKCLISVEEVFDELQSCRKNPSWPLVSLVSRILEKRSELFQDSDLTKLLDFMCDMLCNCNSSETLIHIYSSCKHLMKAMSARNLDMSMWLRVWETITRSAGFNQNGCHSLLQTLVAGEVPSIAGLESLLRMYMSSNIQPSDANLQTLISLLSYYHLPENSGCFSSMNKVEMWDMPISCARETLLRWLCTNQPDIALDIQLLAKVLTILVVKTKHDPSKLKSKTSATLNQLKSTSFETDYCLNVFEGGLLQPPNKRPSVSVDTVSSDYISSSIVDQRSLKILEDLMRDKYLAMEQGLMNLQENTSPRKRDSDKLKVELTNSIINYARLMLYLLSLLMEYGVVNEESFVDSYFDNGFKKAMNLLKSLVPDILKLEGNKISDIHKTYNVLESLCLLYGNDLLPPISSHLCEVTVQEIIVPIVDMLSSNIAEDGTTMCASSLPIILEDAVATDINYIQACCLRVLTLYSFPTNGIKFVSKQNTVIKKLFNILTEDFDLALEPTFMMVHQSLSIMLAHKHLDQEKHVKHIIKLLQTMCKHWSKDAEASSHILSLLKEVFKCVSGNWERCSSATLFGPFRNKLFGPEFTVQFISCIEELLMVDPNSEWAKWPSGYFSSLRQKVDIEIPQGALQKFEDGKGNVAIVEEAIFFLLSPFHEVRLAVVPSVVGLLAGFHHTSSWMRTMFERLLVVLRQQLIIQGENMYQMDEISNRAAVVLHVLVAITATSVKCYNEAIFLILCLIKEKKINLGLSKKVFSLLLKALNLKCTQSFFGTCLSYLLQEWVSMGSELKDFPFALLNFSSFSEFLNHFKGIILPVVFKCKDQERLLNEMSKEVNSNPSTLLEAAFPSIYVQFLPCLADRNSARSEARSQYNFLASTVGIERVKDLTLLKIDDILIELTKLVWDPCRHELFLALDPKSTPPRTPHISHDDFIASLKYLQEFFEIEIDLLVYIGRKKPIIFQRVLLQLREDLVSTVTLDQSIKALHTYIMFAHAVTFHLQNGEYRDLEFFLISDITHTLLYMIRENRQDLFKLDVCSGSCSFLNVMYEQLLPDCAAAFNDLLPTIVGCLIPLCEGTDALAEWSFKLLKLLLVDNSTHLKGAIGKLPPFPDTHNFQEIRKIHQQLKYEDNVFTLEEEIQHFLNSAASTSILASQDIMFDALIFLRKQLCDKKTELADMYQDLVHIRGFSRDCQESILHQLICKLINLTSSSNRKVQIEASRCLGELGPADLTTIVLRPVEGCFKLVEGYTEPQGILCVMVVASHLASEHLLDHDVSVVKKASSLLESLMLCRGSEKLHSSNIRSKCLQSKKIAPFIPKEGSKLNTPILSKDNRKLNDMVSNYEIWCPSEEVRHNDWITNLVSSLIICLSDDIVFRNLASLCGVKSSFAEEMLPVLFYLGLKYSTEICHKLCMRLSQFFQNHCESTLTNSQTPNLSPSPTNIFLDRASVQCMLNVVNYVRLQRSALNDEAICFEVNYLHVASAAQYCSAYLSSIMYMELWCNTDNRHVDFDGTSVAYVDYIFEIQPAEGKELQSLLSKAYQQIGDKDALYGCGSSMLLNSERHVTQYEYIGKWDKVLLNYDAKLSHSKDEKSINGLVDALKHSGLVNLLSTFVSSLPADQNEQVLSAQVECMWRLGEWAKPLPPASKALGFEWNQYSALQAIRDGNKSIAIECIEEGRLYILKNLAYSSLEISKNIYKPLAQLQALQEIEDFVAMDDTQNVVNKWINQSTLPFNDILLMEPILAQRAKLMENLIFQKNVEENLSQNTNYLLKTLTHHYLDTAILARKKDEIQMAEKWLHSLSAMPHLSKENKRKICLEEAQLAWNSCRGSSDVGTTSVARQLLGSLLKELKTSERESASISPLLPEAYILYGRWMAEARSENPMQIIEDYLQEALQLLEKIPTHLSVNEHLFEAHCCLAHFADLEYQRITAYIKSDLFQSKVQCMEKLKQEASQANQIKAKEGTADQARAVRLTAMYSDMDNTEIKNTYEEQNQFIELAMRHYLKSMKLGHGDNLPVFRMVSLWLENSSHDTVNDLVRSSLEEIQSYKFIVLLPQLAARMGDNMKDTFTKTIFMLLMRCCCDHPHHTLPHILALANSYEDSDVKVKPDPEPRVLGAIRMLSELKKDEGVIQIVNEMDKVAKALISFAYAEIPSQNSTKGFSIANTEKIRKLQNLQHAMLPTICLPVQSDAKYHNIIRIEKFETKYVIAGGINKPKKIMCQGTDGILRPLLVKGRDDLRQDAVMQQVFNIMNTLLQNCQETKCRRLLIRTYKIVPLSQRCGVLEWCQNTAPFQEVLREVHTKHNPDDWRDAVCMKKIDSVRQKSNLIRLNVFKEICKNFRPAFRYFFTERFPNPAEWFDHRLAYVHSVATNSMVGYILGLGDRHVSNILIDKSTAEMIHIDFGIAFEQGKVLPTPETVPFRLTRDVVDGMGLSGVEGVFRRSCEKTMAVLRRNEEKILTILEVLLYDPLYAWSLTPKMAAKRQKEKENSSKSSVSSTDSDGKVSSTEKNRMAERVLCRLKEKLLGTENGPASSIEGQVNRLIQQARDVANLSRVYKGWQAYY